jgi:peroxiredoxin Q/BCP
MKEASMKQLDRGDKAPEFNLIDQNDKSIKLTDFRGKKLLLYFYPKANTSG